MPGKLTQISVRLHNWIEDSSGRAKAFLPKQRHVEGSFARRILGATLLRKEFWSFKGEALAKGLAVGLFVAFTPTIGIQMVLVCILILFIPGNLPIALATCWLTNPVTAVPVYTVEWHVGKWILGIFGHVAAAQPLMIEYKSVMDFVENVFKQGGTLWFGSIITSFALAVAGYCTMMGIVYLERWLRRIKLDDFRQVRREERRKKKENDTAQNLSQYASVDKESEENPLQETAKR